MTNTCLNLSGVTVPIIFERAPFCSDITALGCQISPWLAFGGQLALSGACDQPFRVGFPRAHVTSPNRDSHEISGGSAPPGSGRVCRTLLWRDEESRGHFRWRLQSLPLILRVLSILHSI